MASATWAAGTSSWYVGANWSTGVVPGGVGGPDDVATLDAAGSYTAKVGNAGVTTIGSVAVNAAGATLGIALQGLTVKTALTLNSGRLLLQGALRGGTLVMNGGVMMRNDAAVLDGVRVQGTLDLSAPYSAGALTLLNYAPLTLRGPTTFVAADGASPGLLRVGGSALTFGTAMQWDNAAISFLAGFRTAAALNLGSARDVVGETVGFGAHAVLDIAANASVRLGGKGTLVNGGVISVSGTLTVDPLVTLAQAAQPGTLVVQAGGTLVFAGVAGPSIVGAAITLKDPTAKLVFQGAGAVGATLQDFQAGDTVDLQGLAYSNTLALSLIGGAVQVSQAGGAIATFQLTGGPASYTADQFSLTDNGTGGTLLHTTHVMNQPVPVVPMPVVPVPVPVVPVPVVPVPVVPVPVVPLPVPTPPTPIVSSPVNFLVTNTTTGLASTAAGDVYTGPVAGLQYQYISLATDSLSIAATAPNSFIHSGAGNDAIDVSKVGGNNVLDGSTGSNFLVGGTGNDTFFVDDRIATVDIWSTVSNFHSGDATTIFGVTAVGFALDWQDNQGAVGFTGLTLHATAPGKPIASVTLAGYTTADLSNGRLSMVFGNDPVSGSDYMYVHGN